MLINFLVFVTLPVPLKYTGLLLGIGSFAIYDHTIFGLAKKENFFWAQVRFGWSGEWKPAIRIITRFNLIRVSVASVGRSLVNEIDDIHFQFILETLIVVHLHFVQLGVHSIA